MRGLRLTELYPSIQGEGPRVGVPTTFVRFGGCNMRCPGWPCDTPHAIFPEQWKNDPVVEPTELAERLKRMPGNNVCVTGGEPTMQPADALETFARYVLDMGFTIDVFTNASVKTLPIWMRDDRVSIVLDWKLPGSGEAQRGLDTRLRNALNLGVKDNVKFVVTNDEDFLQAIRVWNDLVSGSCKATFWAGVAWGWYRESRLVEKVLQEDLPWKINVQVHKYVWPGVERGI